MKTILLTNKYSNAPLEIIRKEVPQGFKATFLSEQSTGALVNEVTEADYILAGGRLKITREVLNRAEHLKMIQRSGVGLDTLDLEAIKEKKIPLYVNQGVNAESVAEHTLLLILACLRKLPTISQNTKNGIWKKQEQGVTTSELKGKTVGIIGMGNIARTLVGLLKPFQVKIVYYDRYQMSSEFEEENNMTFTNLDALLTVSDILTIHCALTEETEHLINRTTIQKMKKGAIIINTARGEIVDPEALAENLNTGQLSYAALDVHVNEPIPRNYPLKKSNNVILTPHIAYNTNEATKKMLDLTIKSIEECLQGGHSNQVN